MKERTLLGVLLLRVNQVVSLDHLAAGLWDDAETPRPSATLRVHVSRLRKALTAVGVAADQVVATSGRGYVLQVPADAVDAWRFEQLAAAGRHELATDAPVAAADTFGRALALWRGQVLEDLPLSPAIEPEIVRLEEIRLSVLEDRVEAELRCGHHHEMVGELEQLVTETPLRERLWGQRMVALYRCGRQAEALRAYEDLRVLLREELGIRPSPSLQLLERAVLDQDPALEGPSTAETMPAGAPEATRAEATASSREAQAERHNLRTQVTSFVGRREDCAEIGALLQRYRLVTLTGLGGVGKTRLALQVGAERAASEPDGVWLVELDGLSDLAVVPTAVAAVLGAHEAPGESSPSAVLRFLRAKSLLLILDNCEHLLVACAELAGEIMAGCPDVTILATSRERLRISGELAWPVAPLSDEADATQLFAERAAVANPTLVLDEAATAVAAAICARLDFLPLAIELAAGWMRLLTPEQILVRLDDRLALLSGRSRGVPARHQTLRLLLDWSYGLLTPEEQALLGHVAVFRGGFSLEAAEHLGDVGAQPTAVLQLLAELVDKSLVAVERRSPRASRYRLLETVRQFAWEQLDEIEKTRLQSRHLAWCAELAMATAAELSGPRQAVALDALEADHDNFRHALAWAATGDADTGLLLADCLGQFWTVRGFRDEGRRWLELLLALAANSATELQARARRWLGSFAWTQGDPVTAQRELRESLRLWALIDDATGRCETLAAFGDGWATSGALDEARACYDEALDLAGGGRHDAVRVRALNGLGTLARAVGDWDTAKELFEQCLTVPGAHDDPRVRAQVLNNLAVVRLGENDTAAAAALLGESVALKRTLRDRPGIAVTLINLGAVACEQGALDRAEAYYIEALDLHDELGSERGVAYAVQGLGEVATSRGDYEAAARLLGAAEATRERIGVVLSPAEQEDVDRFLSKARAGVGEAAFERSWKAGRGSGPRPARSVSAWRDQLELD